VISFDAAQRSNDQASQQDFEVRVDGFVVGIYTPAGTAYRRFATATFTRTVGAYTVDFLCSTRPAATTPRSWTISGSRRPDGNAASSMAACSARCRAP
jgi:hypothetical protein